MGRERKSCREGGCTSRILSSNSICTTCIIFDFIRERFTMGSCIICLFSQRSFAFSYYRLFLFLLWSIMDVLNVVLGR